MADGNIPIPPQTEFRLEDLKKGEPDPRGRMVLDLLWSVNEFKIYKTSIGISPFFSDDPTIGRSQKEAYVDLGEDIAAFNHLIHLLPAGDPEKPGARGSKSNSDLTHYERELARCIAQSLLGHVEKAQKSLARLHARLSAKISNKCRVVHLAINLILVAFVWLIALALVKSGYQPQFDLDTREIALAALMGSIGALFSTAVGLQRMAVDPTIGISMHWIYGFQRVLVGMMGAAIIYFGFKSNVLAGLFQPDQGAVPTQTAIHMEWLAFISILAGFSERLVPNLLDGRAKSVES